jgi:hypothetical protein
MPDQMSAGIGTAPSPGIALAFAHAGHSVVDARDFTLTFFSHTFSRSLLLLSEVAAGADVLAAGGVEAGAVLTASCAMASGPHNNSSAGMVFMNRMQKPPKGRAAYPRTSG